MEEGKGVEGGRDVRGFLGGEGFGRRVLGEGFWEKDFGRRALGEGKGRGETDIGECLCCCCCEVGGVWG